MNPSDQSKSDTCCQVLNHISLFLINMSIFERPIRIYRYTHIKICKKCGIMSLSFLSVPYMCKYDTHISIYYTQVSMFDLHTCCKCSHTLLELISDHSPVMVDDVGLAIPGTTHNFLFTITLNNKSLFNIKQNDNQ